jgi:CRISPR-associated protein Csb2
MARALLVSVSYPGGVYRGANRGLPEELPSPARLHAAFVGAAGGGPGARPEGAVLVASDEDRRAVAWLEDQRPIGIKVPDLRVTRYPAVRHRVRAAVDPKKAHDLHRDETPFEPFSALAGPVVFAWPPPDAAIRSRLLALAAEITHVGCADATVVVDVTEDEFDERLGGTLVPIEGRGAGRALRAPEQGRFDALVDAHRQASAPARNRHSAGKMDKQASDVQPAAAGESATRLQRFAEQRAVGGWPYDEVWTVPVTPHLPRLSAQPHARVRTAAAVHRAVVAAIRDDVPPFVTGRDGVGPLGGAGHLAIQLTVPEGSHDAALLLGIPVGADDADRARLLDALDSRPAVRIGRQTCRLGTPHTCPARSYWSDPSDLWATEVPLVLDAPGTPRNGPWTLDDAAVCSVGYALRGPLEEVGFEWGTGWAFRRALVDALRADGIDARAFRIPGSASRFAHRGREGDLLVAVHAVVRLGRLALDGRGLLALGRARHLGGGLLRPLWEA